MEYTLDLEKTLEAAKLFINENMASTSLLQRRLKLGYNRACKIMKNLEVSGVITKSEGAKPRGILVKHIDDAFVLIEEKRKTGELDKMKVALCLMDNKGEYIDLAYWSDVEDFIESAKTRMSIGDIQKLTIEVKEMSKGRFLELDTLDITIHQ